MIKKKPLLACLVALVLLLAACLVIYQYPHSAIARTLGLSPVAWQVEYQQSYQLLPGASDQEKMFAERYYQGKTTKLIAANLYKESRSFDEGAQSYLLINKNTQQVQLCYGRNQLHFKTYPLDEFVQQRKKDHIKQGIKYTIKLNKEKTGELLSYPIEQAEYWIDSKKQAKLEVKPTKQSAWYTTAIDDWSWQVLQGLHLPGLLLKTRVTDGHIQSTLVATGIQKVDLTEQDYGLPAECQSAKSPALSTQELDEARHLQESRKQMQQKIAASSLQFDAVEPFKQGLAQVEKDNKTFYINLAGERQFDRIVEQYHPVKKVVALSPGWVSIKKDEKTKLWIVKKDQSYGLYNSQAGWLLAAKYSSIALQDERYLQLSQAGKVGLADTLGHLLVPVQFDEVKALQGKHYFRVRQGELWGIYDSVQGRLSSTIAYQDFDYCGGCGSFDYVYAKKDDLWGVLSLTGKVLLDFKYLHPGHRNMRSDQWVQSFALPQASMINGFAGKSQALMINLTSKKVYFPEQYSDIRLVQGLLLLQKHQNGPYAVLNEQGQSISDFVYNKIKDPYPHDQWGNYIAVYQNHRAGLMNAEGKLVLAPDEYGSLYIDNGLVVAEKNGHHCLLDLQSKLLLDCIYDGIYGNDLRVENGVDKGQLLFQLLKGNKEGFYNASSHTTVPPEFDDLKVVSFANREQEKQKLWPQILARLAHRDLSRQENKPVSVMQWLKNKLDFLLAESTAHSYVRVEKASGKRYPRNYKGLYSLNGEQILPAIYEQMWFLDESHVGLEKNQQQGVFDLARRQWLVPLDKQSIREISARFLQLDKEQAVNRFWDRKKQRLIALPYQGVYWAGLDGLFIVKDDKHTYLYDVDQNKIISQAFANEDYGTALSSFKNGLAKVEQANHYGLINRHGKLIVPVEYDRIVMNKVGLLRLVKQQDDGFVEVSYANKEGQRIGNKTYTELEDLFGDDDFEQGSYLVFKQFNGDLGDNLVGLLNAQGTEILPPEYDKITPLPNNKGFLLKKNRRFGLASTSGKIIAPVIFNDIDIGTKNTLFGRTESWAADFPLLAKIDGQYVYLKANGEIKSFIGKKRVSDW